MLPPLSGVRRVRGVQEVEVGFALEDQRGTAGEWVAKEPVQNKIAARFRRFLLTFSEKEDGQKLYRDAIRDMCAGEDIHPPGEGGRPREEPSGDSGDESGGEARGGPRPGSVRERLWNGH